ncbi:hypothetical protein Ciccas_011026 [Cichlidogyrus casuarinus]|uniref:Uncharacterized protein n=1 Tax=Cichlidogyrus casuarinus TaxID=1844966 RepID=A0ABD2PSG0_9PLAT
MDKPDHPPPVCCGCRNFILDGPHVKVEPNLFWHTPCLKCTVCQCLLEYHQVCHLLEGSKPICRQDFSMINKKLITKPLSSAIICFSCKNPIQKGEWKCHLSNQISVHFSPNCLRCSKCGRVLKPKDEIIVEHKNHLLLCFDHKNPGYGYSSEDSLENLELSDVSEHDDGTSNTSQAENSSLLLPHLLENRQPFIGDNPNPNLQPFTGESPDCVISCVDFTATSRYPQDVASPKNRQDVSPTFFYMSSSSEGFSTGSNKHTRMRTVLNETQLATLKACYAKNPRPDSITKEQLSFMTGLSCRVIRVWFQNKRCKDKKRQYTEGSSLKPTSAKKS